MKKKGFTLIELIFVLALIGFLGTLTFVSFKKPRSKARDVKRITDLRQLVIAQQMYESGHQIFFVSRNSLGLPEIPGYLPALNDPQPGRNYYWLDNTSNPKTFCAFAILDNNQDCPEEKPLKLFIAAPQITKEICVDSIEISRLKIALTK
jgi:prepilin-type N-terminal cleavage/methylation domain